MPLPALIETVVATFKPRDADNNSKNNNNNNNNRIGADTSKKGPPADDPVNQMHSKTRVSCPTSALFPTM